MLLSVSPVSASLPGVSSQLTTLWVFPVRSAVGAVRHWAQARLRSVATDNSKEKSFDKEDIRNKLQRVCIG